MQYEIGGIQFSQSKITTGQMLALAKCLRGLDLDLDGADWLDRIALELGERGKLAELMGVVLGPEATRIDWLAVEAETVVEVIADFFGCNAGIVRRLKGLVPSLNGLGNGLADPPVPAGRPVAGSRSTASSVPTS